MKVRKKLFSHLLIILRDRYINRNITIVIIIIYTMFRCVKSKIYGII